MQMDLSEIGVFACLKYLRVVSYANIVYVKEVCVYDLLTVQPLQRQQTGLYSMCSDYIQDWNNLPGSPWAKNFL